MAHLIRQKTPPINYYLGKKFSQTYLNTLLSAHHIFMQKNGEKLLSDFAKDRKNSLQEFYVTKDIFSANAYEHGRMKCKLRLLANLIATSFLWRKNVAKEAKTIFNLAQKISDNIIGTHKTSKNKDQIIANIEEKLYDFFELKIAISHKICSKINQDQDTIFLNSKHSFFFPADIEDKKIKIIISTAKQKRIYDIDNIDAEDLYYRAKKEWAKIKEEP